jgi:hypothetical protein
MIFYFFKFSPFFLIFIFVLDFFCEFSVFLILPFNSKFDNT